MKIPINTELESICVEIKEKELTEDQWAEVESDDMFQSEKFCGGFDADEKEFCFSYFPNDGKEYWFQFTLLEAKHIALGEKPELVGKEKIQ